MRSPSVSTFAACGLPAAAGPRTIRRSSSAVAFASLTFPPPTSAIPRPYIAAAASTLSAPWRPRTISSASRALVSASAYFFHSVYISESAESDSAASALFGPAAFARRSSDAFSAFSASGNSARFENVVPIVCSTDASTSGWLASEVSALSWA